MLMSDKVCVRLLRDCHKHRDSNWLDWYLHENEAQLRKSPALPRRVPFREFNMAAGLACIFPFKKTVRTTIFVKYAYLLISLLSLLSSSTLGDSRGKQQSKIFVK